MFLASIRSNNGLFIRASGTSLMADREFPGRDTEFMITNWTHPSSNRVAAGDVLTIRSCMTNGVWGAGQDRRHPFRSHATLKAGHFA